MEFVPREKLIKKNSSYYETKFHSNKKSRFPQTKSKDDESETMLVKELCLSVKNVKEAEELFDELVQIKLLNHQNLFKFHELLVSPIVSHKKMSLKMTFIANYGGVTSLYDILQSQIKSGLRWSHEELVDNFYQIINGLEYLHRSDITHGNLDTRSILVNHSGVVKIAYIGQHSLNDPLDQESTMSNYRAPELVLELGDTCSKADIWSAGCIFLEMITTVQLFQGTNLYDQWPSFVQILGKPKLGNLITNLPSKVQTFLNEQPSLCPMDWSHLVPQGIYPHSNNESDVEEARNLLAQMLVFDPAKRISDLEILDSLYFDNGSRFERISTLPNGALKSQILTRHMIRQLAEVLPPKINGYNWKSIFSSTIDGFTLLSLYKKMSDWADTLSPVLLIVRDRNGNVFGALLSCALQSWNRFYGRGDACFLFRFQNNRLEKFSWTATNEYFIHATKEFLSIGADDGRNGLWIDGMLNKGRSQRCATFDNEPLAGEKNEDFSIEIVEAFGFAL